jgi:hypothetical protein
MWWHWEKKTGTLVPSTTLLIVICKELSSNLGPEQSTATEVCLVSGHVIHSSHGTRQVHFTSFPEFFIVVQTFDTKDCAVSFIGSLVK